MSGSVTVTIGGAGSVTGSVTIPASSAQNAAFLQMAISNLGTNIAGQILNGGGTASAVGGGGVGVVLNNAGGVTSLPATGYGLIALSSPTVAATVQGGDNNLHIVSGLGGLTYAGGAESIIATGGSNNITATGGGAAFSQFVDVAGTSTVTADFSLVQTEGGASSINAGTTNFVVYSGQDTITTGAGPNTVAAVGSVGGVVHAGSGDLLYVVGGTSQGVQTIFGGMGNETVFAGPKGILWEGSNPGGSLLFIGGPTASTILGGGGNETLFGGTGGDVYHMGSGGHNIVVAGSVTTGSANLAVTGGSGQTDIYGNAGANITLTDDTVGLRNLLVVGSGAETINASAGSHNTFVISSGTATLSGSSLGGDEFDIYNQGSGHAAGTITITNFAVNSTFQSLVFIGYGFNPTNVHDGGSLASQPTQTLSGGSNHITLSDNTTIVLQDFNQIVNFNNFNAII